PPLFDGALHGVDDMVLDVAYQLLSDGGVLEGDVVGDLFVEPLLRIVSGQPRLGVRVYHLRRCWPSV
ncbi:MAG: hypothetical protein ACKPKO_10140, partial [Candidatus Fonsibacter sp.]